MDKLTQDFGNSLVSIAEDDIVEYLELGIDSFIEDGILKEIPIVSTITSGLKIAKNVHDRNLLQQTLTFINELNNGSITRDKLIAHQSTIIHNPKKCEKELGRVLIYLNSFVDKEKSIMLAKLYMAYIIQTINWDEFCEYSEVISRLFIQDIEDLKKIYVEDEIYIDKYKEKYRLDRLSSLGLINLYSKSKFSFDELLLDDFTIAKTEIGIKITSILFT